MLFDRWLHRRAPLGRSAQVLAVEDLTPHMRRLVLGGAGAVALLQQDAVDSPAAWVKVFPPGRSGRAYTISELDRGHRTVALDFVLHGDAQHDDGSVAAWAARAQVGDVVDVAGPRHGGMTLLAATTWVWLAADLSALPALRRILQALPASLQVRVLVCTEHAADRQLLHSAAAQVEQHWETCSIQGFSRASAARFFAVGRDLPPGGQVWIAGEAGFARTCKNYWTEALHWPPALITAKGYWKLGERDHRDRSR